MEKVAVSVTFEAKPRAGLAASSARLARRRVLRFTPLLCAITLLVAAHSARAQQVQISYTPPPPEEHSLAETLALGAAGAASGFLLHESGHIAANLMLGNVPHIHGTKVWGFIPFVLIQPEISCRGDRCTKSNGERFRPGRGGGFFIVTAGFHVQHLTDEILLTINPNLAREYTPFQKGLMAFNVFLSVIYAVGAYTGLEDPHGDLVGAQRRSHVNEAWIATALLIPAALDLYRFFVPSARWAAWASRASKAALFGVAFAF